MKFFSAFPCFSGRKSNITMKTTSLENLFGQNETDDLQTSISSENVSIAEPADIKTNASAASAAYLKFVKSHDIRVNSVKKHN